MIEDAQRQECLEVFLNPVNANYTLRPLMEMYKAQEDKQRRSKIALVVSGQAKAA